MLVFITEEILLDLMETSQDHYELLEYKIYQEILLQYVKFVQNESLYKLHFAKTKIVFKEWAHPTVIMRYLVRINLNLLTSGIGQNCLIKV